MSPKYGAILLPARISRAVYTAMTIDSPYAGSRILPLSLLGSLPTYTQRSTLGEVVDSTRDLLASVRIGEGTLVGSLPKLPKAFTGLGC